jgi:NRPS condensation-like uncharacterized protein
MDCRKVGYFESICIYLHEYAMGSGTIVTIADISGSIDPDIMMEAIQDLYLKHPLLHSIIEEKEGDYFFNTTAKQSDLVIEFLKSNISKERLLEKELNTQLNPGKSLWRMLFKIDERKRNPIHTLVFTCHHAIADGISSMTLIKELIKTYEKMERGLFIGSKPLPFLGSIEDLSLSHKDSKSYLSHLKNILSDCKERLPIEREASLQNRKSRVLFIDFSSNELESIHRAAKSEKLSINDVLVAAYARALQEVFKKPMRLPLYTPVDMRERSIPSIDPCHFGMYVSYIINILDMDRNKCSFFEFARQYKELFEKELRIQGYPPLLLNMKTKELFDHFEGLQNFDAGLCFNNLGKLSFSGKLEHHRIESFYFSQTRKSGDFPVVHHVATLDGTMHLCIVYVEPLMSHKTAEAIVRAFIHELEKHCGFNHKGQTDNLKAS